MDEDDETAAENSPQPTRKPLDFKELFNDQPSADYFPVAPWERPIPNSRETPSDFTQNAKLVDSILHKKLDISALPPPSRVSTAPTRLGRPTKTPEILRNFRTPQKLANNDNSIPQNNEMEDKFGSKNTDSFYGLFASNDMPSEHDRRNNPSRALSTSGMRARGTNAHHHRLEEESKLTIHSDSRSLAFNPKSEQQISLKVAKRLKLFLRYV